MNAPQRKNKEGREREELLQRPYCCAFHTHCACIEGAGKSFHLLLADTVDCSKTISCNFSILQCQKDFKMPCPNRVNLLSASQEKSRQINAFFVCLKHFNLR